MKTIAEQIEEQIEKAWQDGYEAAIADTEFDGYKSLRWMREKKGTTLFTRRSLSSIFKSIVEKAEFLGENESRSGVFFKDSLIAFFKKQIRKLEKSK